MAATLWRRIWFRSLARVPSTCIMYFPSKESFFKNITAHRELTKKKEEDKGMNVLVQKGNFIGEEDFSSLDWRS